MLRSDDAFKEKESRIRDALKLAHDLVDKIEDDLSELYQSATHHADGLIFSATARCLCGSGLAYRENQNAKAWECAKVIVGEIKFEDEPGKHESYPFFSYEIKSELQPTANGQTTRF